MARYARVSDGVVEEIIVLEAGFDLDSAFHPDVVATMHACAGDVGEGWSFDGSSFSAPVQTPPDKATLKAYAASKRWQIETSGITVAGAAVQTDRASQAMITGAFAYAQANPSASIAYKAAGGFVTLTAAEIEAIANAVGAHVQACFAAEAELVAEIESGTITAFAEIDTADWPGA